MGSNTGKEQKENSQIENGRQAPQSKLAFIVGSSMLKYVDGYLFTGSLDKKIIVKVRPFYSAKPEDIMIIYNLLNGTLIQTFSSHFLVQITCIQNDLKNDKTHPK